MFVELVPLRVGRPVLVTVAKAGDKTLRANGSSFPKLERQAFPAALEVLPAEIVAGDCFRGRPSVC